LFALTAASSLLSTSGAARGSDISWNGPVATPAPFEVGSNWVGGVVPADTDFAFIDNGGIASISTFNASVLQLQIGSGAGKSGGVTQSGGHLDSTTVMIIGNGTLGAVGSGSYTMNGGTLTLPDAFVGEFGSGTFTMNAGTVTSAAHFRLGRNEGGTGVLNMHGGSITCPGFLLVGEFSPAGSPNITTGTVNMDAGTITMPTSTWASIPMHAV